MLPDGQLLSSNKSETKCGEDLMGHDLETVQLSSLGECHSTAGLCKSSLHQGSPSFPHDVTLLSSLFCKSSSPTSQTGFRKLLSFTDNSNSMGYRTRSLFSLTSKKLPLFLLFCFSLNSPMSTIQRQYFLLFSQMSLMFAFPP